MDFSPAPTLPHAVKVCGDAFGWAMRGFIALGLLILTGVSVVAADDRGEVYAFTVPGWRGQILDAQGRALAKSIEVRRLTLRVPRLASETAEAYVAWVDYYWNALAQICPDAVKPERAVLVQHFLKRRGVPLPISGTIYGSGIAAGKVKPDCIDVQTEFVRTFPRGKVAAHAIGYVTPTPSVAGQAWKAGEPQWRASVGRSGLEAAMNQDLGGGVGTMFVHYGADGRCTERRVTRPPLPGVDVQTTLRMEIQEAAEKALADGGRSGAVVVVNALTGDIWALASGPTFDPDAVAGGLDSQLLVRLMNDPEGPLVNRTTEMVYPPGSVMKPLVALAGLRAGCINAATSVPCGPDLSIDGFEFHNWTDWERGGFDLRAAITRSCNTYFFQAAIATGDQAILATAREFGYGLPPPSHLSAAARAVLPRSIPSRSQLADFVIGHGGVAVTPLEVAMGMAALANGQYRPRARLVTETRDQAGQVLKKTEVVQESRLEFSPEHLGVIHQAMYSVANHRDGTGRDAHLDNTRVYGKTGTAQWTSQGAIVNAVWFAGFVKDCDPPLAFAVAVEGKKGERIVGGKAAAPVAGQMLAEIFAAPALFGLKASGAKAAWELELLINKDRMPGGEPGVVPAISASGYSAWFPQPKVEAVKRSERGGG